MNFQCFPVGFVRENALDTRCGEIVLMNEEGRSWTLTLKQKPSSGVVYIRKGWRSFCRLNGLKAGASFTFKLIQGGRTPILRLSTTKTEEKADSPSLDTSSFVANVSTATLRYDSLYLSRKFARENCLERRCGEIVLLNEKGKSWKCNLKRKVSCGMMYIRQGWRSFCSANGIKAGSFVTFKPIRRGRTLALRVSLTELEEEECSSDEIESLSTEQESDEERYRDEKSLKKRRSRWKASSSPSQNRFLTFTLKDYFFAKSVLFLPVPFTRINSIKEETKMELLDKNGVKWSTKLRSEDKGRRIRLIGGWKEFFKASCVKIGESVVLELIWEEDSSCILKFCYKVKQETTDEDVS